MEKYAVIRIDVASLGDQDHTGYGFESMHRCLRSMADAVRETLDGAGYDWVDVETYPDCSGMSNRFDCAYSEEQEIQHVVNKAFEAWIENHPA